MTRHLTALVAAAWLCLPAHAAAAVQLVPVVSGLSSPLFVGHAGDGTNRLFIVEQGGTIRVLQPGSTTPTLFLDITSRVLSGGERGLLGLAFHPGYAVNRRFFVYYTRAGDGTIVIAEYTTSANPEVANTTERVLLTIPHPSFGNHNGGMIAFGLDGYLYAGVGDGGSGNDPSNNAQNIDVLLGKILRIDVDNPDTIAGTPYSSPSSNPFVGRPGRDEIFAYGFRNPFRFSFDRTGQQWVGDVGQSAREEVDTPILNGGNYGWRVFEGFSCTNNDPTLCSSGSYIPPIFDYDHSNGRCSVTGGYAYHGSAGVFAIGTYIYGDYCSGEIFTWNGTSQSLLTDTTLNISSFGEDEQGEMYVVGLGGTVHRLASSASCSYAINPTRETFGAAGGTGSVTVTTSPGCTWTAVSADAWIAITGGAAGTGTGTVTYSIAPYSGKPKNRNGRMTIAGLAFSVKQSR
jgi:hypothetical protein